MIKRICLLGIMIFSLVLPSAAWSKTYKVSPADSSVDFEITHQIGFTTGIIPISEGAIDADEKTYKLKKLSLTLDAKGINTYNEDRDAAATSADFFNTEKFPTINLSSVEISEKTLTAQVTIKDITKKVIFDYKLMGTGKTDEGKAKTLVYVSGKLSKKDFNLAYNVTDENGQPLLGDDVDVLLRLVGIE